MSIILAFLFIVFVLKITFGAIRLGIRIAYGFFGLFAILFVGAIIFSLVSAAISMIKALAPVIVVAGVVLLVVYLVKKNRGESNYSYNDNI